MKQQAWCAFRITLYSATGDTLTRDYVRGDRRMSVADFASFALGDFLILTGTDNVRWRMEPIDFETVRINRVFKHTTH